MSAVVDSVSSAMIQGKFNRDPRRSKKSVDQMGFVDIVKVMDTNSLPAVSSEGSDVYNGIEDPASILGKPTDVFDAMQMQSAINDYKPDSIDGDDK